MMDWDKFKTQAIQKARVDRIHDIELRSYLSYAEKLVKQNLPVIVDAASLTSFVGIDLLYLCQMAYGTEYFYRRFQISKKSGGMREIAEPLPDLKAVQNWILTNILNYTSVSKYAKAYVKNQSIKSNARFHREQKVLVSMDVKDFFPSIKIEDVFKIFVNLGYIENVSWFLAHLCCLYGELPQGAPTSPYLSNLRMRNFDSEVGAYALENGWRYTRYADDLTFSGDGNIKELIRTVSGLLLKNHLYPNTKKTRVARQNTRQEVTGIVVNRKIQTAKQYRKKIRQEVYYIKKYGLDSHLTFCQIGQKNYLNHLQGKILYALFINPKDKELLEYKEFISDLLIKTKSSLK